jgi:hypothetical protein
MRVRIAPLAIWVEHITHFMGLALIFVANMPRMSGLFQTVSAILLIGLILMAWVPLLNPIVHWRMSHRTAS